MRLVPYILTVARPVRTSHGLAVFESTGLSSAAVTGKVSPQAAGRKTELEVVGSQGVKVNGEGVCLLYS